MNKKLIYISSAIILALILYGIFFSGEQKIRRYDDGSIKVVENFDFLGDHHGEQIYYYPSGRKKHTISFIHGDAEGKSLWWHENGVLAAEFNYVDGLEEGKYTAWYENGSKRQEITYLHGEYVGRRYDYDESGRRTVYEYEK